MQVSKGLGRGLGSLIPNLKSSKISQINNNSEIETDLLDKTSDIRPGFNKFLQAEIDNSPKLSVLNETKNRYSQTEISLPDRFKNDKIFNLPINDIYANPLQPRRSFNDKTQEELANSIKEHGILQPLIVSQRDDGKYDLIAGERRLRAAKSIDLKIIPVIIRSVSELEKLELSLIENIQREDLNPIEYAKALNRLVGEFNLTQQELAKRLGKNRSSVANTLRYLDLPEEIQESLMHREISEGQAKILLSLQDKESQINLWQKIKNNKLTVRQSEDEAHRIKIKVNGYTRAGPDANILALEQQIESVLGTKVKISGRLNKGRLTIEYYSAEELNNLVKMLGA